MQYDFQLTYSVKPLAGNESDAASVRKKLREIPGWDTVLELETVLVGKLSLSQYGTTPQLIRTSAENQCYLKINQVLSDLNVASSITVYCSLMVDGLGKHITFSV